MWEQILPGLRIKIFFTIVLGIVYPLAMTGISQLLFPHQANGSLIKAGDKVVGSEIIGQPFTRPEYFHPRASSAGSPAIRCTGRPANARRRRHSRGAPCSIPSEATAAG